MNGRNDGWNLRLKAKCVIDIVVNPVPIDEIMIDIWFLSSVLTFK